MDHLKQESEYKPKWENRRKVIFGNLILDCICILYIMIFGDDTKLNETIVTFAFLNAFAVTSAYVFGSVVDDKNFINR